MESFATRQDIADLRTETASMRAEMGRMWAEVRDNAKDHATEDTRRFDGADDKIDALTGIVKEWSGALGVIRWCLCGIVGILGAAVTHLVRHWNP